jgi:hypothetical protein
MLQLDFTPLTRISLFHIYIKIHKAWNTPDDIKGRPIVSSINSPTYFPSKYLDKILQPLIKLLPTNLKDTTTLLLLLYERKFDPNIWFLTADVTALYPSIDIKDALIVIKELLMKYKDVHIPEISTENGINFIIELMKLVLDNNYVEFGDRMWLQIQGTAMGTPFAVVFANLYMTALHMKTLDLCKTMILMDINPFTYCYPPLHSNTYPIQLEFTLDEDFCFRLSDKSKTDYPDLSEDDLKPPDDYEYKPYSDPLEFQRFIDDIFSLWENCFAALIYITILNTLKSTIKLTYDISFSEGVMMEMRVYKGENFNDDTGFDLSNENTLDIELFQKKENLFLHLPYLSYHATYEKVVLQRRTAFRKFNTSDYNFRKYDDKYYNELIARGYPPTLLVKWFNTQLDRKEIILKLQTKATVANLLDNNLLILPILRCERNNKIAYNKIYKIPQILRNRYNKFGKNTLPQYITVSKSYAPKLAAKICSSKMKTVFTDDDIRNFD